MKKTYAFINSAWNNFEVFETGEFEKFQDAGEYAKAMTDEMDIEVEVWELCLTVQPITAYFDPAICDEQHAREIRDECVSADLEIAVEQIVASAQGET